MMKKIQDLKQNSIKIETLKNVHAAMKMQLKNPIRKLKGKLYKQNELSRRKQNISTQR